MNNYNGMTKEEAEAQAVINGLRCRVVSSDGEYFVVTQDYDASRLNLHLVDNIVVKFTFG